MNSSTQPPEYFQNLIALVNKAPSNPPHSKGVLGINAFYEKVEPGTDLEAIALRYYRHFVGGTWERFGETAWMEPWRLVYRRPGDKKPDIMDEFGDAMGDAICMDLDIFFNMFDYNFEADYETVKSVLALAFSAPDVADFRVYQIGDGEVIEGILVMGYRSNGETTILMFLDD